MVHIVGVCFHFPRNRHVAVHATFLVLVNMFGRDDFDLKVQQSLVIHLSESLVEE
jgi:hypothetical protein